MATEWIIELTADNPLAMLTADRSSVSFDRAFDLTLESPTVSVEIGTGVSYDRALGLSASTELLHLDCYPSKDWSLGGTGEGLQDVRLAATPNKGVAAELSAQITDDFIRLQAAPSLDLVDSLTADLLANMRIFCEPSVDVTDDLSASVLGEMTLSLTHLERAFFTIPPDGIVTILNSSSGTQGETKLDKAQIEKGVTTILQAEVTGTRLDTYVIDFFVKISENDLPFIHKSTSPFKGGITIESVTPAPDAPGSRQLAILQIVLQPEDTAMIEKSRTCLYDLRFSNKGAREDYRVAPKKDRGDTGTFTIII